MRRMIMKTGAMFALAAVLLLGGGAARAQGDGAARLVLLGTKGGPAMRAENPMPSSNVLLIDGVPYVIDTGYGVSLRLVQSKVQLQSIRYVFITHHHSDHNLEYGGLLYNAWVNGLKSQIDTYGPSGMLALDSATWAANKFDIDTRISDEGRPDLRKLVVAHEYGEGTVLDNGKVKVTALRNKHPPIHDSFALRFEFGSKTVVFSGDTTYFPPLAEFAHNADYLVHEIFTANFWKDHALGKPILGTPESVGSFDSAMVRDFYGSVYTPANVVITAAGNLTHKGLLELVKQYFDDLPKGPAAPAEVVPGTHARIALRNKKSLEQVHLCMGVPSYPLPHEERFACYVLNTLLGGGMSSRLFQNIRERQGLAYSVFSELNPYRDTGCLSIYAGTSVESAPKVVDSVLKEFRALKHEQVSDEELRRAKDHLKGSLMLGLESTGSRMSNLARQEMYFGRFFTLDELLESIETVTADDVRRIAQTFFDPGQIALTLLGNLGKLKLTRENLAC